MRRSVLLWFLGIVAAGGEIRRRLSLEDFDQFDATTSTSRRWRGLEHDHAGEHEPFDDDDLLEFDQLEPLVVRQLDGQAAVERRAPRRPSAMIPTRARQTLAHRGQCDNTPPRRRDARCRVHPGNGRLRLSGLSNRRIDEDRRQPPIRRRRIALVRSALAAMACRARRNKPDGTACGAFGQCEAGVCTGCMNAGDCSTSDKLRHLDLRREPRLYTRHSRRTAPRSRTRPQETASRSFATTPGIRQHRRQHGQARRQQSLHQGSLQRRLCRPTLLKTPTPRAWQTSATPRRSPASPAPRPISAPAQAYRRLPQRRVLHASHSRRGLRKPLLGHRDRWLRQYH